MDPQKERMLFERMAKLYCKGQRHNSQGTLCTPCADMVSYAMERMAHCPHGTTKPFCSHCAIHCFRPEFRIQVKAMMRYSGPRMLLHAPKAALQHFFETLQEKKNRWIE